MAREMYTKFISPWEAKWHLAHYGQLKGWTVVHVELHQDPYNEREFWPVLTLRKGQETLETLTVQVSQDPEGNGSGHLFIMNSDGNEIVVGEDGMNSTKAEVWMVDEKDTNKMNLINLEDTDEDRKI